MLKETFTIEHIFLLFFQNPRLLVQPPSKVDDDDMVRKVVTVAVVDSLFKGSTVWMPLVALQIVAPLDIKEKKTRTPNPSNDDMSHPLKTPKPTIYHKRE